MDIAINELTQDLDIKGLDLYLLDGAEAVRQQLVVKLNLWTGTWFLNTEFGTPYLQDILGKRITLGGAIAAIKTSINEVNGVQSIDEFTYQFDRQNRKLSITFTVTTPYGIIEVIA